MARTWENILEMMSVFTCIFHQGKETSGYKDSDEEGT